MSDSSERTYVVRYIDGHKVGGLSYEDSLELFESEVKAGHPGMSLAPEINSPYKAP